MTEDDFLSRVDIQEGVKVPYFKGRTRRNFMEETSRRVRAVGGVVPNLVIYGAYLFMQSHSDAVSQFGKDTFKYSEAANIYRQGVNRADYAARTNKILPL